LEGTRLKKEGREGIPMNDMKKVLVIMAAFILMFLLAACGDSGNEGDDERCVDRDGDGYGENCEMGPDCDDSDINNWVSCASCLDSDTDTCFHGCDAYVTISGPDCDDADPNNWISCATCTDGDGDGYRGTGCDLSADCDDSDINNWTSCATCLDSDTDDYFSGCDAYVTIPGPDCDDGKDYVYPGAPELCEGVDNQCPQDAGYGFLDENCPGGPEWPVLAGNYTSVTTSVASDVYVSGNYAYVTGLSLSDFFGFTGGLEIIDVSDPAFPSLAGEYSNLNMRVSGVYVKDNYAYVADDNQGLHIFDVSNPLSPSLQSSYTTPEANDVHVLGDYAYVADGNTGLLIIDVSDPSAPDLAGSFNVSGDLFVRGDYAYMAGGQIINVSDPSSPSLAGSYAISSARHIHVDGDHAYVSDVTGLKIINISDPSSPSLAGQYDTPGYAWGVYAVGNYAFLTDLDAVFQCSFLVINVSDPASPVLAGQYDYSTPDTGDIVVFVKGDYAYVVHFEGAGLQIIQVMR
jgi:hypothetical protein